MKDDKVGAIQRAVAVIGAVGAISGAAACGGETNSHNAVAPPAEQETCENPAEKWNRGGGAERSEGTERASRSGAERQSAPGDRDVHALHGAARSTSIHIGGGGG